MMIGVIDSASQIYHKKRAFSRKGGDSYGKMPVAHQFSGKTLKSLLKILTLLRMCWDGISVFFDD